MRHVTRYPQYISMHGCMFLGYHARPHTPVSSRLKTLVTLLTPFGAGSTHSLMSPWTWLVVLFEPNPHMNAAHACMHGRIQKSSYQKCNSSTFSNCARLRIFAPELRIFAPELRIRFFSKSPWKSQTWRISSESFFSESYVDGINSESWWPELTLKVNALKVDLWN